MKKEFLLLSSILAFCSIAYELLFANTLAMLAGGTIWWHSMTIGIYVAGLGIGTFRAGKSLFPARDLVRIELYLSVIGMSSAFAVYAASALYETGASIAQVGYLYDFSAYIRLSTSLRVLFFLVTQGLVLIVGILSGYEVPLLIRLSGNEGKINRLLAANYIGTLAGTLAFAYFLLPKLDVIYASVFVGTINLLTCVWLVVRYLRQTSGRLKVGLSFCFVWLFVLLAAGNSFQSAFLQIYYRVSYILSSGERTGIAELWRKVTQDGPVTRQKSLYQYIDYFDVSWRNNHEFILSLDTNFQFSSRTERSYHESFAHIPMLVMGTIPKKVLVLGAGDGMLVRELLKYPEIESIKQVELDEEMVELSRSHPVISQLNENSFDNPRLELIIDDAFQYLRRSNEVFDAVFIDFPYPKNYNLAKLFSVEFYGFVRKVLTPEGFMVIDAPIRNKGAVESRSMRGIQVERAFLPSNEITNSTIISTVHAAGFKSFFPYLIKNESFLLSTNTTKGLNFNISKIKAKQIEHIDEDSLAELGQQYFPYKIDKRFVNSVFHPILID